MSFRSSWGTKRRSYAAMAGVVVTVVVALGLARSATGIGPDRALPDLVSDAPTGGVLQIYADADVTKPRRLLLRFNGYVHNKGTGAARDRRPRSP